MKSSNQLGVELTRVRVTMAVMLAVMSSLIVALWNIQVRQGARFKDKVNYQSVRRVWQPGPRGRIFDRNGTCLADNRPSYCLAIYIEELRKPGAWSNTVNEVDRTIDELGRVLKMNRQVERKDIAMHVSKRLSLPFVAWRDIDEAAVARWSERRQEIRGIDLRPEGVRCYPMGGLAAHVLGYIGKREPKRDDNAEYISFYVSEDEGKLGIEKSMDAELTGDSGGYLIRVDASGFRHSEVRDESKPTSPGKDVVLTIDARIQRVAEKCLEGQRGAAVVMSPVTGDILALASAPAFDPNSFTPHLSIGEFKELINDENKPFLNRAIAGQYPPGSTFKPLVALAALESGRITTVAQFGCDGAFRLGDVSFRCWKESGHGSLAMRKGIEQSCNAYFCQIGLASGYERIHDMAARAGLGRRTGLDMPGEKPGLLPPKTRRWRGGDTCNVSIGQGALLVTPLQMAVLISALANGGNVLRPRLVKRAGEHGGEVLARMNWPAAHLAAVKGGMYDVVQSDEGTGKLAKVGDAHDREMSGKTGTAEFGPRAQRKKYVWMTIFAPSANPKYVAVMIIEEGMSGGRTVAPLMRELMQEVLGLEKATVGFFEAVDEGESAT